MCTNELNIYGHHIKLLAESMLGTQGGRTDGAGVIIEFKENINVISIVKDVSIFITCKQTLIKLVNFE